MPAIKPINRSAERGGIAASAVPAAELCGQTPEVSDACSSAAAPRILEISAIASAVPVSPAE